MSAQAIQPNPVVARASSHDPIRRQDRPHPPRVCRSPQGLRPRRSLKSRQRRCQNLLPPHQQTRTWPGNWHRWQSQRAGRAAIANRCASIGQSTRLNSRCARCHLHRASRVCQSQRCMHLPADALDAPRAKAPQFDRGSRGSHLWAWTLDAPKSAAPADRAKSPRFWCRPGQHQSETHPAPWLLMWWTFPSGSLSDAG